MTLTQPQNWVPADEAMRRFGFTDRKELARAIATGRLRARWRGRERQIAIGTESAHEPPAPKPAPPAPPRFTPIEAEAIPESGLSREEASILAEPVAAASVEAADLARASHRRRPGPAPVEKLDRDMRLLRDRVETIAESIEKLTHRETPPLAGDRDADGLSAARFGEVCERIEELKRTVSGVASGERRLVVEATVIPPGRGAGFDESSRRTDPFSELRSRPAPAPDYRPGRAGTGARFARLLVAIAVIAFSFLTGTLILAFV